MDTALRDEIGSSLKIIVDDNLKNNVFSACSIAITDGSRGTFSKEIFNYGKTSVQSAVLVDNKTVFDLASLTKPLVITLSILALLKKGYLQLEDPVSKYISLGGEGTEDIRILHLLEHSSGLPAHREYFHNIINFSKSLRMEKLVSAISQEDTISKAGDTELYSDLGFILLGTIVEKISGNTLDDFWISEIAGPLNLEKELFYAKKETTKTRAFASTGVCQWSNMELLGIVHDGNCRSVGGVAGHAGLFGSSTAVITLVEVLLKMYEKTCTHPRFSMATIREKLQKSHGRWILGFDTPTGDKSSSGQYFSKETIGHLGFTGTSFWMDCAKKTGIVILTNRVLCGDDLQAIQKFRPAVHDLIMNKLTGEVD